MTGMLIKATLTLQESLSNGQALERPQKSISLSDLNQQLQQEPSPKPPPPPPAPTRSAPKTNISNEPISEPRHRQAALPPTSSNPRPDLGSGQQKTGGTATKSGSSGSTGVSSPRKSSLWKRALMCPSSSPELLNKRFQKAMGWSGKHAPPVEPSRESPAAAAAAPAGQKPTSGLPNLLSSPAASPAAAAPAGQARPDGSPHATSQLPAADEGPSEKHQGSAAALAGSLSTSPVALDPSGNTDPMLEDGEIQSRPSSPMMVAADAVLLPATAAANADLTTPVGTKRAAAEQPPLPPKQQETQHVPKRTRLITSSPQLPAITTASGAHEMKSHDARDQLLPQASEAGSQGLLIAPEPVSVNEIPPAHAVAEMKADALAGEIVQPALGSSANAEAIVASIVAPSADANSGPATCTISINGEQVEATHIGEADSDEDVEI